MLSIPEPPEHSPNCPPPVDKPSRPSLSLPPGSVDAHCHVFGPHQLFPYAPDRTFTPVDVPRQRLRGLHDWLGFGRALIVQSACHGTDHAALLDALETSGGRYRGVALVRPGTPRAQIRDWDAAGICGARLNFLPHLGGAPADEVIDAVVGLIAPHGWHLSIHVAGDGISRYADRIKKISVPVVIDHMARVDLQQGLDSEPVHDLLRLLDTGTVWVKLSGADRLSGSGPISEEAVRLAHRLAMHAPERTVWGTDFPHPNIAGQPPDDGRLVDTLSRVAPNSAALEQILVSTPVSLFGFQHDREPGHEPRES